MALTDKIKQLVKAYGISPDAFVCLTAIFRGEQGRFNYSPVSDPDYYCLRNDLNCPMQKGNNGGVYCTATQEYVGLILDSKDK